MGVYVGGIIKQEGLVVYTEGYVCSCTPPCVCASVLNKVNKESFTKNVTFEQWPTRGEGLDFVDILVQESLFLTYFTFITIHQKVFISSIIRNQEGQASDESD
jgi:hypothetical protein